MKRRYIIGMALVIGGGALMGLMSAKRARKITVFDAGAEPMIAHYMQNERNTWHTTASKRKEVLPGEHATFWFRNGDWIVIGGIVADPADPTREEPSRDVWERIILDRGMLAIDAACDGDRMRTNVRRR